MVVVDIHYLHILLRRDCESPIFVKNCVLQAIFRWVYYSQKLVGNILVPIIQPCFSVQSSTITSSKPADSSYIWWWWLGDSDSSRTTWWPGDTGRAWTRWWLDGDNGWTWLRTVGTCSRLVTMSRKCMLFCRLEQWSFLHPKVQLQWLLVNLFSGWNFRAASRRDSVLSWMTFTMPLYSSRSPLLNVFFR